MNEKMPVKLIFVWKISWQTFNLSADSRVNTPQDFDRNEKQDEVTSELKSVESQPEIGDQDSDKPGAEVDITLKPKKKKEPEFGVTKSVSSLNKGEEKQPVPSQRSKLTGKARTGWI